MITAAAGGAAAQEDRVDMPNLPGLRDEREFSLGVYSPDLREPPAGKPRGHRGGIFLCVSSRAGARLGLHGYATGGIPGHRAAGDHAGFSNAGIRRRLDTRRHNRGGDKRC